MELLTSWDGTLFTWLVRATWQASLLVLLVLAVQALFRSRLSPVWRYNLWLLVVARLVMPTSPESAWSIFNWTRVQHSSLATSEAVTAGSVQSPRSALEADTHASASNVSSDSSTPDLPPDSAAANPTVLLPSISISPSPTTTLPSASVIEAKPVKARFFALLPILWVTGLVIYLTRTIGQNIRFASQLRKTARILEGKPEELLNRCRQEIGVRQSLPLWETSRIQSPAVYGFFKPLLLLPAGMTEKFSDTELRYIFLHELAHIKRRDMLMNWLLTLLQALHWFNPIIWYGFGRLRADREVACDALALLHTADGEKQRYGATIIKMLETFTRPVAMPNLVGILEDGRQMQKRIRMIARFKRPTRWSLLAAPLLATLAVATLTDAQTTNKPKDMKGDTADIIGSESLAKESESRPVWHGTDPDLSNSGTNLTTHLLTITVVDTKSGNPLPNAEISIPFYTFSEPGKRQPVRFTDERGQYRLKLLVPPSHIRKQAAMLSINADHPQFAPGSIAWTSSGGDVYSLLPSEAIIKLKQGVEVGGVVRDSNGNPMAGVRVLLTGSSFGGYMIQGPGASKFEGHEYSELQIVDPSLPAAKTDASGAWTFKRFPPDLRRLEIKLVRPDDSIDTFATFSTDGLNERIVVPISSLLDRSATFTLRDGHTVRGIVVDENGKPLEGVKVVEGYGHGNIQRVSETLTDKEGRFVKRNRTARQWIYTASAAGRATVSTVVQVGPEVAEVRLMMPPAKPIRVRVTDKEGNPLSRTQLVVDTVGTEGQILDWQGVTDGEGRAIWTNAPNSIVTFFARNETTGAGRKFKAKGGDPEKLIILDKAMLESIRVKINAVDAVSNQPVKVRSVAGKFSHGAPFKTLAEPNRSEFHVEIQQSEFQVGMYPHYELKLEAENYASLTTEPIDLFEGDQELLLALQASHGLSECTVLLPDGKPAGDAIFWYRDQPDGGNLFSNAPKIYHGDRLGKRRSDESGRLKLPSISGNPTVVITHPDGILETPWEQFRTLKEVRLHPWGRVEGKIRSQGKPVANLKVNLATLLWTPDIGLGLIFSATTDADGKFSFNHVPPGEFKIYRQFYTRMGRSIPESHPISIIVQPGQTLSLEFGGEGRQVVGLAQSIPEGAEVDWQNDDHILVLKQSPIPKVSREDFASFKAFNEADASSRSSPIRLRQAREARSYQLLFEPDGSFKIDDVPSGKYELRIRVTKPLKPNEFRHFERPEDELGTLVQDITIPQGTDPYDLGTLIVPFKMSVVATKGEPLSLAAQTIDGKPIDFETLHGRHVLIGFWATWSEHSQKQWEEFQKIESEYGRIGKLTLVSLSLDKDIEVIRNTLAKSDPAWTQAYFSDGKARMEAIRKFGLETLPKALLIDPQGQIVGRDLEGERLMARIKRAVGNP